MKKIIARFFIISLLVFPLTNLSVTQGKSVQPVEVKSSSHTDNFAELAQTLAVDQTSQELIYNSEIIKSDIPAWMVAAKISLVEESTAPFEFSFKYSQDNQDWSDWTHLHFSERDMDLSHLYVDPYALDMQSSYFQYQIELPIDYQAEIDKIEEVKLVTLDPTGPDSLAGFSLMGEAGATESINIITREEWGADESIMFWDEDMEHAKIDQVVIHHTAGNDNSPVDPEATIRAIYHFHTVEREWGDIGYNYIVDQHGNIYEGRKGGLGVVAAHAYGFNYGSVGISVLGNFMESYPADDSVDAVADIVSYVSFQTGLDLEEKVNIDGEQYDPVVGHRDVGATSCPGDKFYELIPEITEQAISNGASDGAKTYDAELSNQSDYLVELYDNEKATVTIDYKNLGNAAWLEGLNQVTVVTSGEVGRDSQFADSSWISTSEVGDMYRYTAMPGDYGQFEITLSGIEEPGNFLEKFSLSGPDGIIPDTEFSILINSLGEKNGENELVKPTNKYGISPSRYQATFYDGIGDIEITSGQKKKVWLEFTNTGDNIWYNFDPFPMHLGATSPADHNSDFYSSSDWLTSNRINLLQTYVSPGEVGHFEFTIDATNVAPGTYTETFSPVLEHLTWLDEPVTLNITVS